MENFILPSPLDLMKNIPLRQEEVSFINASRKEIQDILNFRDSRHLLIVGPCSIHDLVAAREYAVKLKQLAIEVSSSLLIVMRVYFEKARSSLGWRGFLTDPFLDGSNQVEEGIILTRRFLKELACLQIPSACEFLDPFAFPYYEDLICWGCIGARTSASQIHRQFASDLKMPIAFKNSTEGNVEVAAQGIQVASIPQSFIGINPQGKIQLKHTSGNQDCHLMLRGGHTHSNYDPKSIQQALNHLGKLSLPERLLIDCSHDNSRKIHDQQQLVFQSVIHQILEGNQNIRGTMLESFLYAGNQLLSSFSSLQYGVSITDPCLDWNSTEQLIRFAHEKLKQQEISTIESSNSCRVSL